VLAMNMVEQVGLGSEVIGDGSQRHSGPLGDAPVAHRTRTPLDHQQTRGVEDPSARLLGAGLHCHSERT
jgi:hypothetical protein